VTVSQPFLLNSEVGRGIPEPRTGNTAALPIHPGAGVHAARRSPYFQFHVTQHHYGTGCQAGDVGR
jgi:hypothetical protein